MISHTHKFIFTHIPKTAGTSLSRLLMKFGGKKITKAHWRTRDIIRTCNINNPEDYFKFAIVRNPWSRMLSYYDMLVLQKQINISFEDFVTQMQSKTLDKKFSLVEQHTWITNEHNEICVDYIGKFEQLQESVDIILSKIGVKNESLQHVNKGLASKNTKHYTEYYNNDTKHIVGDMFSGDISRFEYVFPTRVDNI